jgi:hypothetical protein
MKDCRPLTANVHGSNMVAYRNICKHVFLLAVAVAAAAAAAAVMCVFNE